MKKIIVSLTILIVLFVVSDSFSGTYYVRKGSNGDGSSWTNAWGEMSSINVTNGQAHTIYIAGGTTPYTTQLSLNRSGSSDTNRIIYKRATVTEHGNDTGWSASYDATIQHDAGINIGSVMYVTVDGVTWRGWHIYGCAGEGAIWSSNNNCGTSATVPGHITLSNLWVDNTVHGEASCQDGIFACLNDSIIEHCDVDGYTSGSLHGDAVSGTWNRVTLRYSHLGRSLQYMSFYSVNNIKVYGNLFYKYPSSNTTHAIQSNSSVGTNLFYNNVMNCNKAGWPYSGYPSFIVGSYTGWYATNNAFIDCTGYPSGDHNAFSGGGTAPSQTGRIVVSDLGFTSVATGDYTLKSTSPLIAAGSNLRSPYNYDFNGNLRPESGAWDIGAYQYSTSPGPSGPPSPPANVRIAP